MQLNRKLFFGERVLYGEGKYPFNIVFPFKLRGSFKLEEITHALKKVQQKHLWLNSFITVDDQKNPFFVVDKNSSPTIPIKIVERHNDFDWQAATELEWHTLFDTTKGPLIRLVWIKGHECSEMIFVMHHCLCDGMAAIAILTEFLQVLDHPDINIGLETPIIDIKQIIPSHILHSKKQKFKALLIAKVASLALNLIPTGKNLVQRETDYLLHWKFDEELSQKIMAYCKLINVTVNTFLCAIVLYAFKSVKKEKAFNKISCPVNIRRFSPSIKKDQIFAFGLMLVVSAKSKLDFLKNVQLMQKEIEKKSAKLNPYIVMMVMENAHKTIKKFTSLLKNGKSSNDCMFSNLGKLDIPYQYNSFDLETIFSPSVIGPLGNTTTLITSTYRNQLDFTFVGSQGFLPYQDALLIKSEIIANINQKIKEIIK